MRRQAVLDLPLIIPAIRLDGTAAAEEAQQALRRAQMPWVAGFCVFGGDRAGTAALVDELRRRAGRPLLIASDMERGAGQQVQGLGEIPDAGVLGMAASPAEVRILGEAVGREALSVGVNVLFAPVLDVLSEPGNPIVGNRSFGWDPNRVSELGAAFIAGVLRGGAIPVAKHFPGHGATQHDSHVSTPLVLDDRERLYARDLLPFQRAVEDLGCPAVMTAHVAYRALDGSDAVATLSPSILGILRSWRGGSRVAVFTDALLMEGVGGGRHEAQAARAALRAGCDFLLYPANPERVAREMVSTDGGQGDSLRGAMRQAARRASALVWREAPAGGGVPRAPEAATGAAEGPPEGDPHEVSLAVSRRAVRLSGAAAYRGRFRRVAVVAEQGSPEAGSVLTSRAQRAGLDATLYQVGARDLEEPPLVSLGPHGPGPQLTILLSRARAARGGAGLAPGVARLLHGWPDDVGRIWCTPCPWGAGPHIPGAGPWVEAALADLLLPA